MDSNTRAVLIRLIEALEKLWPVIITPSVTAVVLDRMEAILRLLEQAKVLLGG